MGLTQASVAARALPAADLAPPQPRPKTTAAVARRLIGAALGNVNGLRDKVCRLLPDTLSRHALAARTCSSPGSTLGKTGSMLCWCACMHASAAFSAPSLVYAYHAGTCATKHRALCSRAHTGCKPVKAGERELREQRQQRRAAAAERQRAVDDAWDS